MPQIGRDLKAVKSKLHHGQWLPWLEAEFGMSDDTARNFINVAERFGEQIPNNSGFGSRILYLLAAPSTPDAAIAEATKRAEDGEKLTVAQVQEMRTRCDPPKEG